MLLINFGFDSKDTSTSFLKGINASIIIRRILDDRLPLLDCIDEKDRERFLSFKGDIKLLFPVSSFNHLILIEKFKETYKDKNFLFEFNNESNEPEYETLLSTSTSCLSSLPSEIISNLYIGDYMNSQDETLLSHLGISVIVNVSQNLPNVFETLTDNAQPVNFFDSTPYRPKYLRIPLNDDLLSSITTNLKEILTFLQSALDNGSKVLVHCYAGISRSPSIVIAYLMSTKRIPFKEALAMVSAKRSIIEPNLGFTCQLLENEKMIMRMLD